MFEPIGSVFGETTTEEFEFVFPAEKAKALKNAFVIVKVRNYEVIGKVKEIVTDNPLLSPETLKFFVEGKGIGRRVSTYLKSSKFLYFMAKCEVLGEFDRDSGSIKPLTKPVESGADVYFIDREALEKIFFEKDYTNLYPGFIESPGLSQKAKFSLKGDEILTMHCGVFGMTGMGKTTTTGTLLEELTIRGAKSVIFDPHGDYINLGSVKPEIEATILGRSSTDLQRLIEEYRDFLRKEWEDWKSEHNSVKDYPLSAEMERELLDDYILFRLILLMTVLRGKIPSVRNLEELSNALNHFAKEFPFNKIKEVVPNSILKRVIKLRLSVFPSLIFDPEGLDKYFLMNLFEAFAGEEVTETQEGKFLRWIEELKEENFKGENETFLESILSKAKELSNSDKSKAAIIRKIEKASGVIKALKDSEVQALNSYRFIKDFVTRNGPLSIVSNVIFDLSRVSPEIIQRALLYAILDNSFSLYKSRKVSIQRGDSQLLFVIEEARVLIPKSGAEEMDHPATSAARNIVRRIATEGRKMGLGLLIISQKPSSVDPIPVSQCNTLILHRVINPEDLSFVKEVGESISEEDVENLKTVEKGVAIVTGTALKHRKSLMVRFRDRLSREGAEHPQPLKRLWKNNS